MKAVIHTGSPLPWAEPLARPWPLLPFANRPWIEFWIEWACELGIQDIILVLGDGAYEIESEIGDGSKWGVRLQYSFLRDPGEPDRFLARKPERWAEGFLYVRRPVFPYRHQAAVRLDASVPAYAAVREGDVEVVWLRNAEAVQRYAREGAACAVPFPSDILEMRQVSSLRDYFELNMAMVDGVIDRYLTPGYRRADRAYLGYHVVYPPSAEIRPPVIIGNHVRIQSLATVGPRAILGNRIIVDRQSEISDSIILDGAYLGASIELKGRIVAGCKLIDPHDGTALDIEDAHLIDSLRPDGAPGEKVRRLAHRVMALALFLIIAPLALPLIAFGLLAGGRFEKRATLGVRGPIYLPIWRPKGALSALINRLSMDRWPWLWAVMRGDLWLCGQAPVAPEEEAEMRTWPLYRPGLFSYADMRPESGDLLLRRIDASYYAHHRGWREDAVILLRGWWNRIAGQGEIKVEEA